MTIQRRDIWIVTFNPTTGHEQQGQRPAVVVSSDLMNADLIEMVYVAPGTTTNRKLPNHIEVTPTTANGLRETTYFMGEQLRSLSTSRLIKKIGVLDEAKMLELDDVLITLLDLGPT